MTTDERLIKENFNPRPREEGDEEQLHKYGLTPISIHALVKRATRQPQTLPKEICYFNPRPREEGDGNFLSLSL